MTCFRCTLHIFSDLIFLWQIPLSVWQIPLSVWHGSHCLRDTDTIVWMTWIPLFVPMFVIRIQLSMWHTCSCICENDCSYVTQVPLSLSVWQDPLVWQRVGCLWHSCMTSMVALSPKTCSVTKVSLYLGDNTWGYDKDKLPSCIMQERPAQQVPRCNGCVMYVITS